MNEYELFQSPIIIDDENERRDLAQILLDGGANVIARN